MRARRIRRLLPLAYEWLYLQPPELDHIAFVSLSSCAGIPKALPVLKAMGIRACAVAYVVFAYTHVRKGGPLEREAADMAEARRVLARLLPEHGFTLDGNGLPQNKKQNGWRAADAWTCFAADQEVRAITEGSHAFMKENGVWNIRGQSEDSR